MPLRARLSFLHPIGRSVATKHRLYDRPAVLSRNPSMRSAVPLAVMACLALGACAPVRPADTRLPTAFEAPAGAPAGAVQLDRWWLAFGDAELTGLIDQALVANPDARSA